MSTEPEFKERLSNSYLFGSNAPYVEELYESYLEDPTSVPDQWRTYFDQLQHLPATDGNEQTRDSSSTARPYGVVMSVAGRLLMIACT